MMLSTKGRYAVMAMVDLATQDSGKPVTLAAIAERQEIPLAYLEQIFAKLKRRAIVGSVRGPGGGYTLAKPAEKTCIAEIIIAAEEDIAMTRCGSDTPGCMASKKARCLTHDLWEGLTQQIEHYLQTLTLADVCARRVREKFPRDSKPSATAALLAQWQPQNTHQTVIPAKAGIHDGGLIAEEIMGPGLRRGDERKMK